jgi:hypothetical protein
MKSFRRFKMKTVSWFSTGVSSAVATKLMIDDIDEIIYTHINDQHEDSLRFVKECEEWFGRPITILQSHLKDVETACLMAGGKGYINGPSGAACTMRLKKNVRIQWEKSQNCHDLRYIWGLDCTDREITRAVKLIDSMPIQDHIFPLIDKQLTKEDAHEILKASGIARPKMYELGYQNNNCIGCVKGGQGYWNKIRTDFPAVFEQRAKMERKIGASCLKNKEGRIYLDELHPDAGRNDPPIVGECGILCELLAL